MTVTAVIDLNSISGDGTTRVKLSNLNGPVGVGDDVLVNEPEEDVSGTGAVARISDNAAHITVDRQSLR
ncbi:hypothetical protein [Curtobacterium sp. MCSS17_016]|uniref:hypothetical protein n=1 Tax=Curtobacterium sp. MCSS17_016 TaxID=2175644 RepID=UPI000DA70AD9|nr:hypothetical protein [Curtobacterium sp. MCSS17_016]WIE80927.1 hypothetical protein DEJ19_020640 [Curtobacterium sp. MCSS17_016]